MRPIRTFVLLLAAAVLSAACTSFPLASNREREMVVDPDLWGFNGPWIPRSETPRALDILPADARKVVAKGSTLFLDVRTEQERQASIGDPTGTLPLPFREAKYFVPAVRDLAGGDTSRIVVLICRVGIRSRNAGDALARAGFTEVCTVHGGPESRHGWAFAGLPLQ